MAKDLLFGLEAKEKLIAGISKVSEAVSSTLGPKGNNVAIERKWGSPSVIHDGVSVAKEIDLVDKYENMGAQLIKEAAQKTNDKAGDGTTTATILTEAIVKESLKAINAGANPMMLRKGIEKAVDKIVEWLDKTSSKVKNGDEIKNIATISAQDEEIGGIISDAIKKLGRDAVIAVEEGKSSHMSVEYKEGFSFDKGFVAPHFITDEKTQECVIERPYILITDRKINSPLEFNPFIQKFASEAKTDGGNGLVIIAEEISGNPLATMILNKMQNNFPIVAIEAPIYGGKREDILKDMAFATGGVVYSQNNGKKLAEYDIEDFGRAEKIIVSKNSTVIVGGVNDEKSLKEWVEVLGEQIEKSENEFDTEKLIERRAKLTSGMAIINVGANSEMEVKEKKERCIDAVSATQAAIAEGIVPGGEVTLLKAHDTFEDEVKDFTTDENLGFMVVLRACCKPFEVLMTNSGYNAGQMSERLCRSDILHAGVNVITGEIEDMIEAGIIDPVKVTKSALAYAASTATMIMTTNTLIVESKESQEPTNAT